MTEAPLHDVAVVGSANLDVVLAVPAVPLPGETLLATGTSTGPGGKGANQAIAAARAGARTAFVAALGDDAGGRVLREALTAAGVDLSAVRTSDRPTGTAYVMVDRSGENAIVVDAGANDDLHDLSGAPLGAAVVLCSLEVPLATVTAALVAAPGLGVLNAAPAQPLPDALLDVVDVLVVNEQEALAVSGAASVEQAAAVLGARVAEVVVTLGPAGALLVVDGRATPVPGVPARAVVDTTGAGDTFCGAFAAARARGDDPLRAAALACAAASLSVERPGAGSSCPTLAEAQERLGSG